MGDDGGHGGMEVELVAAGGMKVEWPGFEARHLLCGLSACKHVRSFEKERTIHPDGM